MTPKGQMAFGGGPPITHLPPAMKAMFQPGPPLPYKEKIRKRKCPPYSGLASLRELFETTAPPERVIMETPRDRREAKRAARVAANELALSAAKAAWDPVAPRAEVAEVTTTDAYKTLFVGRLSYETTEAKLRREFEQFGPIKAARLVAEPGGKPRGYAFIEFEKEADMRTAYKRADGRRVDGRRILVDVERGRTVRNWKPRRLGGGLGGQTRKKPSKPANGPPRTVAPPAAPPHRYAADRRRSPSREKDRGRAYRDRDDRHRDRDRRRRDRSRSRERSRRY